MGYCEISIIHSLPSKDVNKQIIIVRTATGTGDPTGAGVHFLQSARTRDPTAAVASHLQRHRTRGPIVLMRARVRVRHGAQARVHSLGGSIDKTVAGPVPVRVEVFETDAGGAAVGLLRLRGEVVGGVGAGTGAAGLRGDLVDDCIHCRCPC